MKLPFYTVGHSTRTLEAFSEVLRAGEVELVVDVRTVPKSRTNPQYNGDTLGASLATFGVAYEPIAELGGLRGKSRTVPPEVNGLWENQSFHNYADYTLSDEFHLGLGMLIALGRERRTAMMCSEAVWWRCHRRIVSDCLLARGETVFHLMGRDRVEPAHLTTGARAGPSGAVSYPRPWRKVRRERLEGSSGLPLHSLAHRVKSVAVSDLLRPHHVALPTVQQLQRLHRRQAAQV